ncbi:T9SS type A sorting domain-containing protein, partial [Crocinitomix sp.]|nr:T9SS type A sorting domain-containing protein [Crocinitomix sp.]
GGVPGYDYAWSSGGTGATESGLGAGTYTVIVSDTYGCSEEASITITQPDELIATASVVSEPVCFSDLTGEANVTVVGGVGAYTYSWSSGGDAATETGLGAGTYTITVEDANGCTNEQVVTITQPDDLIVTATVVSEPLCFSDLTGEGNATVTGGVEAYSYAWSSGGDAATESGLGAGTYTITVEDANGCVTEQSITITEPDELIVTATVVSEPLCFSDLTGEGNATVTGGVEAYSYAWSSGGDAATESGLGAGTYTITVEDANGCSTEQSITITEPDELIVTPTVVTEPSCFSDLTGEGNVTVTGGVEAYSYSWSSGGDAATETGLGAGTFTVTVEDANGCTNEHEITITEPDEIVATATITIESFGSDGAIDVTVTGGTPEYTYSWSNGEETEDISGLEAGVYVLTVTDENGCTKEFEFVIDSELGIERIANNSFKLYPNPASTNVYIANNNQIEILSIQLYNSLGQLVFVDENATNTDYVMDVSEMAKGVYYIALNAQNQVQTIKLIIE